MWKTEYVWSVRLRLVNSVFMCLLYPLETAGAVNLNSFFSPLFKYPRRGGKCEVLLQYLFKKQRILNVYSAAFVQNMVPLKAQLTVKGCLILRKDVNNCIVVLLMYE